MQQHVYMLQLKKNPFEDTFNHTTPGQRLLRSKDPARFKPPEATGLVQPEVRLGPSLPGIIHHHTRKLPSHGRALLTDPSVYLHNSLDDTKILSESLDQRCVARAPARRAHAQPRAHLCRPARRAAGESAFGRRPHVRVVPPRALPPTPPAPCAVCTHPTDG